MPQIYAPQNRPWLEDDDHWLTHLREEGVLGEASQEVEPQRPLGRGLVMEDDGVESAASLGLESSGDSAILIDEVAAELDRLPDSAAVKKLFWELLEFEPADEPLPREVVVPANIGEVRIIATLDNCAVVTAFTHGDDGLAQDVGDVRAVASALGKTLDKVVIIARHDQQVREALLVVCSDGKPWIQPLARETARVEAAKNLVRLNPALRDGAQSQLNVEDLISPGRDTEFKRWLRASRPISDYWLELQVTSSKLLTAQKERELFSRLAEVWPLAEREAREFPDDPEARRTFDNLLQGNLRMSAYLARRYCFRVGKGLTFEDLYQAGLEGLCISIRRFDLSRQFRFSTYATWWVRQCICREIGDREATVRLPIHLIEAISQVSQRRRLLEAERGPASFGELAGFCGLSAEKTVRLIELEQTKMLSMDESLEDSSITVGDQLADDLLCGPVEEEAIRAELGEHIRKLLSLLKPREEQILRMRFGIGEKTDYTLEEIGKQYFLTRERIRQIEAKALDRLRVINGLPSAKKKTKQRATVEHVKNEKLHKAKKEEKNGKQLRQLIRGPVITKEKRGQQLALF